MRRQEGGAGLAPPPLAPPPPPLQPLLRQTVACALVPRQRLQRGPRGPPCFPAGVLAVVRSLPAARGFETPYTGMVPIHSGGVVGGWVGGWVGGEVQEFCDDIP